MKHAFGERVVLPDSRQPPFARLEIEPSILGRMAGAAFKRPELWITLELYNGRKRRFRIVSGMVRAGFVISPLVEDIYEFAMLHEGDGQLDRKRVRSISIGGPDDGRSLFWSNDFTVRFGPLDAGS